MTTAEPSPELLLSHADFVRGLARSLMRDANAAEDVAQEAMAAALERPPRALASPRAWLARVTRNFAKQAARGEHRRRWREREAARPEGLPGDEALAREAFLAREAARAAVVRALLAVPEPSRGAILLRYYEGLPVRAIAARLGVPAETVRTRIKRGLARMRGDLAGEAAREGAPERWLLALAPLAAPADPSTALAAAGLWTKGLAAAVLALGGAAAWRTLAGGGESDGAAADPLVALAEPRAGEPAAQVEPLDAAGGARAPVAGAAPAPAQSARLAGRTVDPRGAPVAGVLIYASPDGPPQSERRPIAPEGPDATGPREPVWVESDAEGRFELELAEPGRAYVAALRSSDPFLLEPEEGRWVEVPAEHVELAFEDAPLAEVSVRALEADSGRALADFSARFSSERAGLDRRAEGALLRCELPLGRGLAEGDFDVLVDAPGFAPWKSRVRLSVHGPREVEARLERGARAEGLVLDESGAPIEGALVYFGAQSRMRGDEPFKPFEPARIKDGALSGADGRFEVSGHGERVTAWHADFGAATRPLAGCARIVLPSPGAIRGRVLDRGGRPRDKVLVICDRAVSCITDAEGRFAFEHQPAGVRGLMLQPPVAPDGSSERAQHYGVELASGATVELELGFGLIDVELRVASPAGAAALSGRGFLIGLEGLTAIYETTFADGRAQIPGALPGRYLLLSREGPRALVELDGAVAEALAGGAVLRVRGTPGERAFALPPGASELVELMAARLSARAIPADGELVFAGLPPGTWALGTEARGVLATAEVPAEGSELALP